MPDIAKLTKAGKELGLEGKELQEWVEAQQQHEREERQKDREMQLEKTKMEREAKEAAKQLELQRAKEERERSEIELEQKKVQQDIIAKELQLEGERAQNRENQRQQQDQQPNQHRHYDNRSKLPIFDEKKDSIDNYLARFERYAKYMGWEPSTWADELMAYLRGDAFVVLSSKEAKYLVF